MGQPGCNDVIPSSGGGARSESFIDCDKCHEFVTPWMGQGRYLRKAEPSWCKFFGRKDEVGLIGGNGCESYEAK